MCFTARHCFGAAIPQVRLVTNHVSVDAVHREIDRKAYSAVMRTLTYIRLLAYSGRTALPAASCAINRPQCDGLDVDHEGVHMLDHPLVPRLEACCPTVREAVEGRDPF